MTDKKNHSLKCMLAIYIEKKLNFKEISMS